jgi:hypothetical protein
MGVYAHAFVEVQYPTGAISEDSLLNLDPNFGMATADVQSDRSIVIGGAPAGSPVSFVFGIGLAASVSSTDGLWGRENVSLDVSGSGGFLAFERLGEGSLTRTPSYQTITWFAGVPFDFNIALSATTGNVSPCLIDYPANTLGQCTVTADGSDTAAFSLELLTPGTYYTTSDGPLYPTVLPSEFDAVVEPSSIAMLIAPVGGILLVRVGRRRREFGEARSA